MEYANHLNDYAPAPTSDEVAQAVSAAMQATGKNCTTEVYRFLLSAIDLTTLSCTDSEQSVAAMARRAAEFDIDYPHLQNVASICVYPPFVETAGLAIDGTSLKITAVAGGFPSSQTFLEVKMLEVAMAIESGADEIDIVLNPGLMLSGHEAEAASEVELLREEAMHPLQGPVDGLVPLPGVGAVKHIAGEQHQIAALPDAQLRDLSGHLQQARPELAALQVGKFPQGGIDVPVCGV